jgi:2-keto-3-deoxy-L-rhamnonate aldolase RhmA
MMGKNPLKRSFDEGRIGSGMFVGEFGTRAIPWILANEGLDFVVYDTEHGGLSEYAVRDGVLACRAIGITPIVRVRAARRDVICPYLDAGALGVMVPMVESGAQARAIVDVARYHPLGTRGTYFGTAHDLYDAIQDTAVTAREANENVMLIAQIETARGVEQIDEICETPGLDMVWIGHNDLSHSLGIPGRFDDPRFLAAVQRVVHSALSRQKSVGRLINDPAEAERYATDGYQALALSSDLRVFRSAVQGVVSRFRGAVAASAKRSPEAT